MINDLYHADCIEEDVIVSWHAQETPDDTFKKELQAAMDPFVRWLQEAEEEDEEEDD